MCPGSMKIMSGYNRGKIYDRLHDLSKQQNMRLKAAEIYMSSDPEATYHPKI